MSYAGLDLQSRAMALILSLRCKKGDRTLLQVLLLEIHHTFGATGDPKGGMISHENIMSNMAIICEGVVCGFNPGNVQQIFQHEHYFWMGTNWLLTSNY